MVLNIATQAQVAFFPTPNSQKGAPTTTVDVPNGAGGIENILFLEGGSPVGTVGPNADTALLLRYFLDRESDASHEADVYAASVCVDGDSGV